MFKLILFSMRPLDWTKNLFVFVPLVFSQNLFNIRLFIYALSASLIFCLASSSIYITNDIKDRDEDKAHPIKANRPVASQSLSAKNAAAAALILHAGCLILSWFISPGFMLIVVLYLLLHILYSFFLKKVVVLDVMVIAAGLVLRVLAGSAAIRIETCPWILLCTAQIAFFFALTKRRQEAIA
ncbi:MAG: UbiA family prenyltransferase [Thermodesulfobacteriota bacterium]|nr:UbiA family prenyltransferase [Thermodesulfobacteriota bacterium]